MLKLLLIRDEIRIFSCGQTNQLPNSALGVDFTVFFFGVPKIAMEGEGLKGYMSHYAIF